MSSTLAREEFENLRRLSTCAVANAIETFNVRLRNVGFSDGTIRSLSPRTEPMLGYAVTLAIKCSSPPTDAHNYFERTQWWDFIVRIPSPRIIVIQDVDERPGTGALIG